MTATLGLSTDRLPGRCRLDASGGSISGKMKPRAPRPSPWRKYSGGVAACGDGGSAPDRRRRSRRGGS